MMVEPILSPRALIGGPDGLCFVSRFAGCDTGVAGHSTTNDKKKRKNARSATKHRLDESAEGLVVVRHGV